MAARGAWYALRAITMHDRIAVIDPDICERCGLCWSICPTGAVELTYV